MKKLIKISLNSLKILLFILAFSMAIFTIITLSNVNNGKEKDIFGFRIYSVLSDSMKPEFQAGDIIITKIVEVSDLEVGDIITFYSSDPDKAIITHQIVRKEIRDEKEVLITKGINVAQEDTYPVQISNVLGRYSFSVPKAGYVIQFIKRPIGYLLLITLPLIILLALSGIKIFKTYKQYKHEQANEINEKNALLEEERIKNQRMYEELRILKERLNNGNNG